jgi:hypothetical protein
MAENIEDGHCDKSGHDDYDKTLELTRQALAEARDEIEHLRVQLAGCSTAALGYARDGEPSQKCGRGDYGWSPALEDVKALYESYDKRSTALHTLYQLHDQDTYVNPDGRPSPENWGMAWQHAGEALGQSGQAVQEAPSA